MRARVSGAWSIRERVCVCVCKWKTVCARASVRGCAADAGGAAGALLQLAYMKKPEDKYFRGVVKLEECIVEELVDREDLLDGPESSGSTGPEPGKDGKPTRQVLKSSSSLGQAQTLAFRITNKTPYKSVVKGEPPPNRALKPVCVSLLSCGAPLRCAPAWSPGRLPLRASLRGGCSAQLAAAARGEPGGEAGVGVQDAHRGRARLGGQGGRERRRLGLRQRGTRQHTPPPRSPAGAGSRQQPRCPCLLYE